MEKIEAWQGSSFNVDLGLQARATDRLYLGASAMNVGSKFSLSKTGAPDSRDISLPTTYRVGAAYQYKRYLGAADIIMLDDQAHLHLGVEAKLHELLAVRAGYMTNYDSKNLTAGASFIYHNIGIDYAFVPYSNDLGSVHLFGLTIRL